MAEAIAAIKAIFAAWEGQARLDFRGEFYTHTMMAPNFNPGPNPFGPPPVLLGALGPVMTRTAAEVADGLLVMPFNSANHFAERTVPAIGEGLRRSGRTFGDFQIIAQAMVAVGRDEAELATAINGVASLIAFYGSTPAYLPVLQVEGWADVQPELNALSKQGRFAEMRRLITDEMVARIGIVGTPEECAQQIAARFGEHADEVLLLLPRLHAAARRRRRPDRRPAPGAGRAMSERPDGRNRLAAWRYSRSIGPSSSTPTPPRWVRC